MSRKYATDPEDNEFIEALIRVVEQCSIHARIQSDEQYARDELLAAQLELDSYEEELSAYSTVGEPTLDPLIELSERKVEQQAVILDMRMQAHEQARARVRTSTTQRHRLLSSLYKNVKMFIARNLTGDLHCEGLEFDARFAEDLSRLVRRARRLKRFQSSLLEARRDLLHHQESLRMGMGNGDRASKAERKRLLAECTTTRAKVERQKQDQLQQEQTFFLKHARPILVAGGVLAPLTSPVRSPILYDPETLIPRPKEHGSGNVLATDARLGPHRQTLYAARARAAKANDALDQVQKDYIRELADFLVTYEKPLDKEDYDVLYRDEHDGKSYETVQAEAAEEVRQAEAECDIAWREAVDAGITDLPPSPKDLGDRSEDGRASSCDSDVLRLHKQHSKTRKPRIQRWGRGVARAGSPAEPEDAPHQTLAEEAELASPGSREYSPGIDVVTSRDRIDRYERHRKRTRERVKRVRNLAVDQEAERVAPTEEPSAKRRCIIL